MVVISRRVFLHQLILFFVIQSCVSPDQNFKGKQEKTFEPEILVVNNDSLFSINGIEFGFSEFSTQLSQSALRSGQSLHVTIQPDSNVKMSTIKKIQGILASESVQEINYLYEGKLIRMKLVLEPTNQIKLEITKDDKLIIGNTEIKSDKELLSLLQASSEGVSNPQVVIKPEIGSSYNLYLDVKNRVQKLLAKHDLTIELREFRPDYYERIE